MQLRVGSCFARPWFVLSAANQAVPLFDLLFSDRVGRHFVVNVLSEFATELSPVAVNELLLLAQRLLAHELLQVSPLRQLCKHCFFTEWD